MKKELSVKIRNDFPILKEIINGKPLVYLDNAATSQKPKQVLGAILHYYKHENANVHRGLHTLANHADMAYSHARENVKGFINAEFCEEVIFVKGTTDAINLVAHSYCRTYCKAGDEILLSTMEHHSNIIPWQILRDEMGIKISSISVTDDGDLDLEDYERLLKRGPKLVALTHVSNVLGTINPVKKMIFMAHELGIPVLLDGAQAISHIPVDVQDLDCDFYAFSGHKMYAPTGIGVLYGKKHFLEKMLPYQGGGGMIAMVSFDKTIYADLPAKFEAGTPNIEGAIGLSSAIDYLKNITMAKIEAHDRILTEYAYAALQDVKGIKILGVKSKDKIGVVSFVLDDIHPHDIGTILDSEGIAIRAGNHCAMPLLRRFNLPATARISFGLYNTKNEIDFLIASLAKVKGIFANE